MSRASQICSDPNCSYLKPCPKHAPKPWGTSGRSQHVVSGSMQAKRKRYVLSRDGYRCHVCGHNDPPANQADHVIPVAEGGPDRVENMKAIHSECHKRKTQEESKRGKERVRG